MALYPDPLQGGTTQLQGGTPPLQGSAPQLQQPVPPQQTATSQNPAPAAAPVQQPAQVPIPQSALVPTPQPQPQPQPTPVPPPDAQTISQRVTTPDGTQTLPSATPNSTDPYQNLAETAGSAGLSVDDLVKLATANSSLSPDEIASIRKEYGLDNVANTAFGTPTQSTVDLYNQAYAQAGLGDLKSKIQALSSQIADQQNKYAQAVGAVDENPFLSENSRVGRQKTIAEEAQQEIANLQQEQSNLNDLYTQGVTEVNAFITRHTNDFNTTKQQAAAKLDYLTKLADQTAQATAAQKQQQVYRYAPDYLQAKQQATEPFGSAQYGYFKYDPNTKSYVQVSGPAAQYESNPITGELFNNKTGQVVGSDSSSIGDAFGAPAPAQTTLAQKNNNPGNIRNPVTGQFQVYTTPQQGWTALVNDIQAKMSGNNSHGLGPNSTLQDFFNVYAPTGDGNNNPASYAQAVAQQLGVSPTTKLGDLQGRAQDLAVAIATHEGYFNGSTATGTPSGNIIDQSAQQLVDGTAAPSQFSKRGAQYQLILDKANQLSQAQKGVPFDAQQSETLFQNKQAIQPIKDLESSLEAHLNLLSQQSKNFKRSDTPAQNQLNFAYQQQVGPSNDMLQYLQTLQDAKGELAKVLSGGGTPTDEARAEADSMLNEYLGDSGLQAQIQNALTNARQKLQAYQSGGAPAQQNLPASSTPVDISDIIF